MIIVFQEIFASMLLAKRHLNSIALFSFFGKAHEAFILGFCKELISVSALD